MRQGRLPSSVHPEWDRLAGQEPLHSRTGGPADRALEGAVVAAPLNLTQRRESTSPPRAGLLTAAGAATQIQTSHLSGWDSNPETAALPSPPPPSPGAACPSHLEDERSPNDRICLLSELRESLSKPESRGQPRGLPVAWSARLPAECGRPGLGGRKP